ncbi:hypothetical protein DRN79_04910 [Methanosarcinales archaeon]|nr:MAG: hypothetical protein DRN79_04910 [Methanosarcinales archaeon]
MLSLCAVLMTPPHHVERISCLFQPLLLKLPDFSLLLPEQYINLSKIFYLTHPAVQRFILSEMQKDSISVVLLSYKQAITSFSPYSLTKKASLQ